MPDEIVTDAARRASDWVNLHLAANEWDDIKNKYIAIRLSDGGSDGVLYDSKRDAVRHQLDEKLCAYVSFRNLMAGAKPREMQIFLDFNRKAYDSGFRLVDPDDVNGGPEILPTAGAVDPFRSRVAAMELRQRLAQLPGFKSGKFGLS